MCLLRRRIKKRHGRVAVPYGGERTSNKAFVGHADPGVPLKNLRTCRGGYQPPEWLQFPIWRAADSRPYDWNGESCVGAGVPDC